MTIPMNILLAAIMMVESGGNPLAHNVAEDAVGPLQIRPIMVDECNRIMGRHIWDMEHRYSVIESFMMAEEYLNHHCKGLTPEQMARAWNGGPKGWEKECTKPYWEKVLKQIQKFMEVE